MISAQPESKAYEARQPTSRRRRLESREDAARSLRARRNRPHRERTRHETRAREHRRLRQTEEIIIVEQERLEETSRDQLTERFELQTETKSTIKSESTMNAGLSLSASYGPMVRLSAYGSFSSTESKEQSDRNATNYAKEITDRTLSRLVERVRHERRSRTLEEVEETNRHGFDNTSGEHITGVYYWVDKFYRAKVVNYGKRLLYELIVPEPAVSTCGRPGGTRRQRCR